MGTVTYPDPDVHRYIEQHFVPVQLDVVERPEVMDRFNSSWTPTVLVHDADGREYRRSLGYLDPARLLGELALGRLAESVHRREYRMAEGRAQEALKVTKGDLAREPEALYFDAVVQYKVTGEAPRLRDGWTRLMERFADSDWAKKAEFIRA